MLGRAMLLRCPRCGARRVLATWFKMVERCPSCRLRFERESDFFLGAYVMNLAVTEGLLIVALLAYVFRAVSDPQTPGAPVLIASLVCAIGGPLAFFPFSRTIWCAIDLAMRPVPLEPVAGDGDRGPNGSGT
jgi:uncharacterized protein (DUF983 family)